jgi:hypothetical protein
MHTDTTLQGNQDLDTDPELRFKKCSFTYFRLKIPFYLSLGLYKGCLSYTRSLQHKKRTSRTSDCDSGSGYPIKFGSMKGSNLELDLAFKVKNTYILIFCRMRTSRCSSIQVARRDAPWKSFRIRIRHFFNYSETRLEYLHGANNNRNS